MYHILVQDLKIQVRHYYLVALGTKTRKQKKVNGEFLATNK